MLLKRGLNKGAYGECRTGLLFDDMDTAVLLEIARGTSRSQVEDECARWVLTAAAKRNSAIRDFSDAWAWGRAMAQADLMVKQAQLLYDLLDGRATC